MSIVGKTVGMPREKALHELRSLWEVLSASPQGRSPDLIPGIRFAASDPFLRHSARDVRLWAAKCLAEALRIFAPEPPLEPSRLRASLELFIEQIAALSETSSTSFMHRVALLERLLEIRAFMLLFDCGSPEELLTKLVRACLSAISSAENSGEHLVVQLSELLAGVLAEADEVPAGVVAELVSVLMSTQAGPLVGAPVAKKALASLAHGSAVKVVHEVLSKELYGQQRADDDSPKPVACLFEAVYELFSANWMLVARILPNLAEDLQSRDVERRSAATRLVGRMFAHPAQGDQPPLVEMQPLLFDRYLDRYADAEDQVRLQALSSSTTFFDGAAAVGGSAAVSEGDSRTVAIVTAAGRVRQQLEDRCLDPCQSVRLRVIEIAAEATKSYAGLEFLVPVLPKIFGRIMDKRPLVREVCIDAISNLYMVHGLKAWEEGKPVQAKLLSWAPQMLCDAFSVFAGGHLGHTALLEEYMERCFLGCDENLDPSKRLGALLGFCHAASAHEGARKGLILLLQRKRDANAALRRFVELRLRKGSPILIQEDAVALLPPDQITDPVPQGKSQASEAQNVLKAFVRLCPSAEDRAQHPESAMKQLREVDLIRDKALWTYLLSLLGGGSEVPGPTTTAELGAQFAELGRLLRVHNLLGLESVLRRALVCTWLMPDQVALLLDMCCKSPPQERIKGEAAEIMASAANWALSELPRYFPEAFAPHVGTLIRSIKDSVTIASEASETSIVSIARSTLRSVLNSGAALGKWVKSRHVPEEADVHFGLTEADANRLLDGLLTLPQADATLTGRDYRKAMLTTCLLAPDVPDMRLVVAERLLHWASEHRTGTMGDDRAAAALRFAAACIEQDLVEGESALEEWLSAGCSALVRDAQRNPESRLASVELLSALGCEAELVRVMGGGLDDLEGLQLHATMTALRAVRHGRLQLTTRLLSALADQVHAALASTRPAADADQLLVAIQKFQKPSTSRLRLGCSLRLSATLPTIFSLASVKHHTEAASRLLQSSLSSAVRRSIASQEPFLNFGVAYFLHFLSYLPSFTAEAAALVSAFPESTRVATMFTDALLRCEPSKAMELAAVVLKVVDSTRFFADCEGPADSRSLDKAAWVLRHAVEKRCSELNGDFQKILQRSTGAAMVCSMPADLFVVKQGGYQAPSSVCLEQGATRQAKEQPALAESHEADTGAPDPASQALQALPSTFLTPQTQRTTADAVHDSTAEKPRFASALFQRLGRQRSVGSASKPAGGVAASPRSAAFAKRRADAPDGSEASTPSPRLRKTPRQTPKRRANLASLVALAENAQDEAPPSAGKKRSCTSSPSSAKRPGSKAKMHRGS